MISTAVFVTLLRGENRFNPLAAGGYVGQYKLMQKIRLKMTETQACGYSSESMQQVGKCFQMNTNMAGFRCFSKISAFYCHGRKL